MITSTVAGFAASLALIIAIGAQNAFVLRQGLRREHVLPIIVTCAASDALLIGVGIAGVGVAVLGSQAAMTVVRFGGAAFLLAYAVFAARRAVRPGALGSAGGPPAPFGTTLLTCLALTYLNPHVYLDTVLLLGTVANHHQHRWLFGLGAAVASATWFTVLGTGAHRLAPLLARPAAWRVLDAGIAILMTIIAVSLAAG